jgi:hypothetical protein
MTAIQTVRRTQRVLGGAAIAHALMWGTAAAIAVMAAAAFATLIPGIRDSAALPGNNFALLAGVIVAGALIWRSRRFVSADRVALWVEERIPELHYSLVTAMEQSASPFVSGMETTVARQNVAGVTWSALRRPILRAIAAVLVAGSLLYVSPSAAFGGGGIFAPAGAGRSAGAIPAGSRLENVSVRIAPPAYTGERTRTIDDPASIPALSGSGITVRGRGSATGIAGSIAGKPLRVVTTGDGWSLSFGMPRDPAALTLVDRKYERIVVLEPRADNPPKIALTSPPRDSILRVARLVTRLDAVVSDDIGLGSGYFEYLITSGSGEVFSARTVTTPVASFNGSRTGSLSGTLDLASLKLGQGDVVSVRAIAQDMNTLTGPGIAMSDTRTFRIARAGEYDSIAVDAAAPPPVDSSAMSQRMLVMMAEKLVREQKKISRSELVRRSGEIGDLEDRIRKRVQEILYEIEGAGDEGAESASPDPTATLEGEESDQVRAVHNPDLVEAFNALWEAVRSLQIAEPEPALRPMRVALKALDRARLANRLYLRGTPPRVVVDLARVRMTGKEKGAASVRTPRSSADSARAVLERRFNHAVELLQSRPSDAVRAFTLLQVDALSVSPPLATSLGEAISAFRRGSDATVPLLRARRLLAGDPASASGLPSWSGGW